MADAIVAPDWWKTPGLEKLDRRTRRTREALYGALAALLTEKDLSQISVTELTRAADVNRSTFYIHFADIRDMMERMHRDFAAGLDAMVSAHADEMVAGDFSAALREVYGYFERHREAFTAVFGRDGEARCFGDVAGSIRAAYERHMAARCPGLSDADRFALEFGARGSVGMLQAWVEGGCAQPVDEMVARNARLLQAVRAQQLGAAGSPSPATSAR